MILLLFTNTISKNDQWQAFIYTFYVGSVLLSTLGVYLNSSL